MEPVPSAGRSRAFAVWHKAKIQQRLDPYGQTGPIHAESSWAGELFGIGNGMNQAASWRPKKRGGRRNQGRSRDPDQGALVNSTWLDAPLRGAAKHCFGDSRAFRLRLVVSLKAENLTLARRFKFSSLVWKRASYSYFSSNNAPCPCGRDKSKPDGVMNCCQAADSKSSIAGNRQCMSLHYCRSASSRFNRTESARLKQKLFAGCCGDFDEAPRVQLAKVVSLKVFRCRCSSGVELAALLGVIRSEMVRAAGIEPARRAAWAPGCTPIRLVGEAPI